MKKYFPILLSKAGELTALYHLRQNVKDETSPVIEVIAKTMDNTEVALIDSWSFDDNEILLDFNLFEPFNRATVRAFFINLFNAGVNAVPVIQQNSNPTYITLVQNLVATYNCKVGIRTNNGSGGFVNYNATVSALMGSVGVARNSTILLLDLGYIEVHTHNNLAALAINTIQLIPNLNQWSSIVVASGSFPTDVSHLLPVGHVHRLQRFEWNVWNTIRGVAAIAASVKYGDYGTKYPFYSEVNFQGSCSIKYTVLNEFVIYRGELSGKHRHGNGQYIIFAGRLIASPDYSGVGFSWGDDEINRIAAYSLTDPKRKPGNAGTWVKISQNHHITFLHSVL